MYRQLYQMGGLGMMPMNYGEPQLNTMPLMVNDGGRVTYRFGGLGSMMNEYTPEYVGGGIMDVYGRQGYKLGKFVKSITKPIGDIAQKIIPKEIAPILRIAAPFLPPGFREAAYIAGTARMKGRLSPLDIALIAAPTVLEYAKTPTVDVFSGETISTAPLGETAKNIATSILDTRDAIVKPITEAFGKATSGLGSYYDQYAPDFLKQAFRPEIIPDLPRYDITGNETLNIPGRPMNLDELAKLDSLKPATREMYLKSLPGYQAPGFGTQAVKAITDAAKTPAGMLGIGSAVVSLYETAQEKKKAGKPLTEEEQEALRQAELNPFLKQYRTNVAPGFPGVFPTAKDGGLMGYQAGNVVLSKQQIEQIKFLIKRGGGNDVISDTLKIPQSMIQQIRDQMKNDKKSELGITQVMKTKSEDDEDDDETEKEKEDDDRVLSAAQGGLMNLKKGGVPVEMDLRSKGGFVPIGKRERADDVPARLSKNEFVFTARAVRNAGDGNIAKGARKMYNVMKRLEAMA